MEGRGVVVVVRLRTSPGNLQRAGYCVDACGISGCRESTERVERSRRKCWRISEGAGDDQEREAARGRGKGGDETAGAAGMYLRGLKGHAQYVRRGDTIFFRNKVFCFAGFDSAGRIDRTGEEYLVAESKETKRRCMEE